MPSPVLLPIRSAEDASLKGFELRVRDDDRAPVAAQGDRCHDDEMILCLSQVLSSHLASRMADHGLRLWAPLSLKATWGEDALAALRIAKGASALPASAVSLVLPLVDAGGVWLDKCLRFAESLSFRVAAEARSGSAFWAEPGWWEYRLAWAGEVRVSQPGLDGAIVLDGLVRHLHELGRIVTCVEVSTVEACDRAIKARADLLQGDLVGRPHSIQSALARLTPHPPFRQTVL